MTSREARACGIVHLYISVILTNDRFSRPCKRSLEMGKSEKFIL